ncbi:MAG: hypothetical protein QM662_04430 [Gordonia sp. (in: high G+C Gram-positive bacteria)]
MGTHFPGDHDVRPTSHTEHAHSYERLLFLLAGAIVMLLAALAVLYA